MFDPTIYDNLKVVLEGCVYDLDLEKKLLVRNRKDLIDAATMARTFYIEFSLKETTEKYPYAGICLHFSVQDYTTEIIANDLDSAGCTIRVDFFTSFPKDRKDKCQVIEGHLKKLWNNQGLITQELSYNYTQEQKLLNKISIDFQRKINENQVNDLESIVHHCMESLVFLDELRFS